LAEIVRAEYVRVRDAARQSDLLLEPIEQSRVGGKDLAPKGLDRDEVVELAVVRLVDDPHASLAQDRLDVVAAGEERADLRLVLRRHAPAGGRGRAPREQSFFSADRDGERGHVLLERRLLLQLLEHRLERARED